MFQRALIFVALLLASVLPGNAITFNNRWDPSIARYLSASDVAAFQNAVVYAESLYQNVFTDAITLNITFRVRFGRGTLGASVTTFQNTTYAEIRSALAGSAVTPADFSSVANLPAADPSPPGGWSLPSAEAKALGLLAANDPATDGTIYFGSGYSYTYDPAHRKVAGKYDFIGIVLHEMSEVMGRNTNLDNSTVGGAPYDLFRYVAKGVQSMDPNATNVYFSVDGGATSLNVFNSDPAGDLMDWAGPAADAFNAFGPTNEQDDLTVGDITALDVLGYTPFSYTITTSSAPSAGGNTGGGGREVNGASVTVMATPAAGYTFVNWTEGGNVVSASASYTFAATADRTLVANFVVSATNANLSSLVPGAGVLSPSFSSGTTSYAISLGKTARTFVLTPFTAETGATVKVNGAPVSSGSGSIPVALITGTNVFTTVVTAPNGVTTKTYTLTVTRTNWNTSPDLNNDGNTDFLCQNNAGQIVAWHMNGAGGRTDWSWISTGPLGDWKVVGTGDFNNDGNTDILCQNSAGQITVWYMDGAGARTSWAWISTGPLGDWKVVGTGDFNNDGNTDILCQNNAGQITVWYMNGAGVRSSWAWISTGPLGDWRVVGTGDFNNDGNTDILCQNTAGQITVWYMNGAGVRNSWSWISTGPLGDWRVVRVGDYNNDGNADILCQNSFGQIVVWYMDGTGARSSWAWISTGPLGDWRVR